MGMERLFLSCHTHLCITYARLFRSKPFHLLLYFFYFFFFLGGGGGLGSRTSVNGLLRNVYEIFLSRGSDSLFLHCETTDYLPG